MKKITVTKVVLCKKEVFFDIVSSPFDSKLSDYTKETSNVYREVGVMLPVRADYHKIQMICPEVSNRMVYGNKVILGIFDEKNFLPYLIKHINSLQVEGVEGVEFEIE